MKNSLKFVIAGLMIMSLFASGCANQSNSNSTGASQNSEKYPTKPIELIVPFAAGGGTDLVARALAESMKTELGKDVVVINKTGGSGAVGMNEGLHSKADGYKLTMATREIVSLPLLELAPFKTSEFTFVGNVNRDPAVLVVSSKSKFKTFEDLVADIEAKPGKLKFASAAAPSIYGIPFAQAANLDFITVPFQGAAQAVIEVLGERAEFGLYNPGEVTAQIKSGDLRPLAIMAEDRLEGDLKDVPTMKEKGINVGWAGTFRGLAVPDNTPDEVVKILEDTIGKAVKDQKFIDFMAKQNLFIDYLNAGDFEAMVEKDMKAMDPIVQAAKKQEN
ncbi:tripartite tricarboxylate transporter substrate binding protein [Peribacillus cavernae]|uniref:Tripartite tricarboxylate transporter substrate binding protein n=1 Tax=Peribacillus cavernae TaxID=1674310 RepID=A0A3S0VU11_9BACI|nr:tripartite tricarboxylate transporter substrate binding protein [Peribacillus cavernae]MDQ0218148.1 tripartite-type tricarboxylate transporter receptor subunit TctC [Peribacillus cavernae]RUQ32701.1 tripartite tricarboxylate transporter substrate binding protein [Peribacillus cavernae]